MPGLLPLIPRILPSGAHGVLGDSVVLGVRCVLDTQLLRCASHFHAPCAPPRVLSACLCVKLLCPAKARMGILGALKCSKNGWRAATKSLFSGSCISKAGSGVGSSLAFPVQPAVSNCGAFFRGAAVVFHLG